jgi:hypothetical protein
VGVAGLGFSVLKIELILPFYEVRFKVFASTNKCTFVKFYNIGRKTKEACRFTVAGLGLVARVFLHI